MLVKYSYLLYTINLLYNGTRIIQCRAKLNCIALSPFSRFNIYHQGWSAVDFRRYFRFGVRIT